MLLKKRKAFICLTTFPTSTRHQEEQDPLPYADSLLPSTARSAKEYPAVELWVATFFRAIFMPCARPVSIKNNSFT